MLQTKDLQDVAMFTLRAGPEQRPIAVHKGVLARLSPAFDALVNGSMIEAQECCVAFEEVSFETASLLVQFAYRGDYDSPVAPLGPTATKRKWEDETEPADLEYSFSQEDPNETFEMERRMRRPRTGTSKLLAIDLQHNEDLVVHVNVAAFADMYGITMLEELAFTKFSSFVDHTEFVDENIDTLFAAIDCVMSNPFGRRDLLRSFRKALVQKVMIDMKKLWKTKGFAGYLETHGQFARHVIFCYSQGRPL